MTSHIFLLLGTNLGDRVENLILARRKIETQIGTIVKASALYKTAAWGKTNQPEFLNQVLQLTCSQSPEQLLEAVLDIEKQMGRQREEKWGPRKIDIDILFYNDLIVDHPPIISIPHPGIAARRFVLQPLDEIAGNFIHPILQKSIRMLLTECTDSLTVEKFN